MLPDSEEEEKDQNVCVCVCVCVCMHLCMLSVPLIMCKDSQGLSRWNSRALCAHMNARARARAHARMHTHVPAARHTK
jgi:hypothetical protein